MSEPRSRPPVEYVDTPQYGMPAPYLEEEERGGGFTILQLWYMVRAHLWLSIATFAVLTGLAFVTIKMLPKSYVATAALIVNQDNTDPLAGRNLPVGLGGTFFPTQMELIYNNVVLRPVVARLDLTSDEQFTGGYAGDAHTLNGIVVNSLRNALDVQQGRGSQLLYISATARNPVQAADIANAVSDEYLHQIAERTNAPAIERATRYAAQLAELKEKADAAQARVAEFRQTHGMADLKAGQGGDQEGQALADLQNRLLAAQNLRRQLQGQPANAHADSTAVVEAPEALALRSKLDSLEGEMGQARATLGPRHPRILQLQADIDATRRAMQANLATRLRHARELEYRYQAALDAERARLLERRDVQDEGTKLLLEQQLAVEAYAQALRGQDQVQFASEGNYQDVTMVSRAEPPLTPTKPNKLKLFAAAVLASFALAVGGPFAYELLFDRRVRCRDDLERQFGIVTLAQFGRLIPARAG